MHYAFSQDALHDLIFFPPLQNYVGINFFCDDWNFDYTDCEGEKDVKPVDLPLVYFNFTSANGDVEVLQSTGHNEVLYEGEINIEVIDV